MPDTEPNLRAVSDRLAAKYGTGLDAHQAHGHSRTAMITPADPSASTGRCPAPSARKRRAAIAGALIAAFGGFASFNLMLSAMPGYAVRSGAGPSGAGALTATLMAATLAVQPFTPWFFARLGRRHVLAASGALLGLPCLVLPAASTLPALSGLAAVRGLGFGVFVVAGVTFTAELFPSGSRGRAIGWYGAVVGVAGVLGAPLGIAWPGRRRTRSPSPWRRARPVWSWSARSAFLAL